MTAERISLRRSSEKGLVRPLVILEKTHFFKSAPFISEKRKKEKKPSLFHNIICHVEEHFF